MTIDWEMLTVKAVTPFLPPAAGCTIGREMKLAKRWRACYPRQEMPKTFSQVFHSPDSERQSVLACLRWAWTAHTAATGQPCPYQWLFEDAALQENRSRQAGASSIS